MFIVFYGFLQFGTNSSGVTFGRFEKWYGSSVNACLQDEIESVEYIPLETTADPASLLDGVSEYAVTSNYIYVSPVKEQRIVQFDRKGQFVKTLIPFGQGPGEFSDFLMGMQADEKITVSICFVPIK